MGAPTTAVMTTLDFTIRVRLENAVPEAALEMLHRLADAFKLRLETWNATGSGDGFQAGGLAALRAYVVSHSTSLEFFSATGDPGDARVSASERNGIWSIDYAAYEGTAEWLDSAVLELRAAAGEVRLLDGAVSRGPANSLEFAPSPPIAKGNYAVLTTDAQVAAAYDDPAVFWASWDKIEDVKGHKLCTRALRALRDEYWLGETFEASMAMARAARPHLTEFPWIQLTGVEGPWWDFGDVQDEKAGWPMLDLVGYEPRTETVELAAKPGHDGHVLLQEIDTIRQLVSRGKTRDKKPVKCVRVVFLDEATARVEKRPLLDVGAKVYYMGKQAELVELTE